MPQLSKAKMNRPIQVLRSLQLSNDLLMLQSMEIGDTYAPVPGQENQEQAGMKGMLSLIIKLYIQ